MATYNAFKINVFDFYNSSTKIYDVNHTYYVVFGENVIYHATTIPKGFHFSDKIYVKKQGNVKNEIIRVGNVDYEIKSYLLNYNVYKCDQNDNLEQNENQWKKPECVIDRNSPKELMMFSDNFPSSTCSIRKLNPVYDIGDILKIEIPSICSKSVIYVKFENGKFYTTRTNGQIVFENMATIKHECITYIRIRVSDDVYRFITPEGQSNEYKIYKCIGNSNVVDWGEGIEINNNQFEYLIGGNIKFFKETV